VGRLFLAGVLPGLMMAGLFMLWIALDNFLRDRTGGREPPVGTGAALRGLGEIWPLVLLIVAVLGSLFAGLATPTEAAGVGVAAAIVLGATLGELTPNRLGQALMATAQGFGVIAVVFIGAIVLAQAVSLLGLPQQLAQSIGAQGFSRLLLLGAVVLLYLALGCLFDGLSMMIMTLPFVFPLLTGLGFDAVWLGVVVTLMIEVGMLTPPVGMNLFVLVGITAGAVSLGQAARAAAPYWLLLLAGVALLVLFPGIALWLPNSVMAPT
jgi:tripartite ATP-independent transporter DctM subunit